MNSRRLCVEGKYEGDPGARRIIGRDSGITGPPRGPRTDGCDTFASRSGERGGGLSDTDLFPKPQSALRVTGKRRAPRASKLRHADRRTTRRPEKVPLARFRAWSARGAAGRPEELFPCRAPPAPRPPDVEGGGVAPPRRGRAPLECVGLE